MIKLQNLLDDTKCYETVRELRWPDGVDCPHCHSQAIAKQGFDQTQPARQKYRCSHCQHYFDDLTATVFAGHHQPLLGKGKVICNLLSKRLKSRKLTPRTSGSNCEAICLYTRCFKLSDVAETVKEPLNEVAARTLDKLREMNPTIANLLDPQLLTRRLHWQILKLKKLGHSVMIPVSGGRDTRHHRCHRYQP